MKKKVIQPDDYFSNGVFEIARYGKMVAMANHMDEEQHEMFMERVADSYDETVNDIQNIIYEIRLLVSKCDPLKLLKYAYGQFFQSLLGITSEAQLKEENVIQGREVEYIQSILASTEVEKTNNQEDQSELFFSISEKISEMYKKINSEFFISYTAKERLNNPEITPEVEMFVIESIFSTLYRGERYPVFEIEHLQDLLLPHDDIFLKLYNIKSEDFIKGLHNIQKVLSSGMFSAFKDLESLISDFNVFAKNKNETQILGSFARLIDEDEELNKKRESFINNFVGFGLHDLSTLTDWPENLLRDLSWGIGEETDFFAKNKYSGWPIIEMPVFKRPFIKIDNGYYCFDYYNLFDNIYRVVQKVICSLEPEYKDTWNEVQMSTTEQMVANLFRKLLPGCIVLESNYYPIGSSLKNCAENDLIVIFDDHIFIIEVKAGSYTYTSPVYDIDSHMSSLKTLVGKADSQAVRTLNYLKSSKIAKIYDKNKNEKFSIILNDYNEVATFCITLDNFNEFAAKAEKISFLTLNDTTIAISIDDLRVYQNYFESPSRFLHYIKQRKRAAKNDRLSLNDELDHLGMYIEHNVYSITANNMAEGKLHWHGFRENLDEYFSSLFNGLGGVKKPEQEIPTRLIEILDLLDKSTIKNRSSLAIYLLDLASDAREELSSQIDYMLQRQVEVGRMLISSTFGDVRYSLLCHQDSLKKLTDDYVRDYILSTMVINQEESRLELHLHFSKDERLIDLEFRYWSDSDIPSQRIEELKVKGEEYAESRIMSYKRQKGLKKIGRNEKCPCGSGLKYKKCHGR